jgi:flagellar motility protein MotE (MotC chaperone)
MPPRPGVAAPWSLPQARWRQSLPVVLLAALGILTLAKLGVLVEEIVGFGPAGSAAAVEGTPAAARSAPVSVAEDETPPPAPMPAAGPEAQAPESTGAASTAPEVPPSAAQDFDPSRLTANEIAVLQQLAARRTALDQRARELDRREALLETAQAALVSQIAQLSGLRDQITSAVEQHDAAEEARLKSLVKIYETMKAKAAAEIFNRLEMPVLLRVVERMREAKSADVLARMDPVKARQVTIELAKRTKLLGTPGGGPTSAAAGPPSNRG